MALPCSGPGSTSQKILVANGSKQSWGGAEPAHKNRPKAKQDFVGGLQGQPLTPSTSLDLGNQGHGISTPGPEFDNQGPRVNTILVLWDSLMELHSKFVTAVRKQGLGF